VLIARLVKWNKPESKRSNHVQTEKPRDRFGGSNTQAL
jgi:hypothetical protein